MSGHENKSGTVALNGKRRSWCSSERRRSFCGSLSAAHDTGAELAAELGPEDGGAREPANSVLVIVMRDIDKEDRTALAWGYTPA